MIYKLFQNNDKTEQIIFLLRTDLNDEFKSFI